jgi:threonine/homoserine/homoserine lactone efflux protein
MGLKFLRASLTDPSDKAEASTDDWTYFRQALTVSLTNPKVIMFFMAFFPLFLNADSTIATLFILMAHVTIISLIYQTGLVLIGNSAAQYLSKWTYARKLATRLAGMALIGFGVKLALKIR